ncbi:MAG: hypothetical protein HETSPECPRED_001563 [Heterodermia speciosa]|uniref:Integrase zinc-binding domain-containing protein n=1 Tax=Heterodermia speciosa TaxID=116794 RepID=A0A8H3J2G3_9LECA|nr:MAG: hypothetical protein HETSPECPRED_001563 [Heterodermia speciosa]
MAPKPPTAKHPQSPSNELRTADQATSAAENADISKKADDDLKLDAVYIAFGIDFQLTDDLIYHCKDDNTRLRIPDSCVQDIFRLAHDDFAHAEHHRIYVKLVDLVYIKKLFKQLTIYLRHCLVCQLHQTKKHKFHD